MTNKSKKLSVRTCLLVTTPHYGRWGSLLDVDENGGKKNKQETAYKRKLKKKKNAQKKRLLSECKTCPQTMIRTVCGLFSVQIQRTEISSCIVCLWFRLPIESSQQSKLSEAIIWPHVHWPGLLFILHCSNLHTQSD